MKRSEIAKLLTVIWAAEGLGRQPSDEDVRLWEGFAKEGGWESYAAAERAYIVYRSQHPNFPFRPGHITETLEAVRRQSSPTFEKAIERVPDEVRDAPDFNVAYMLWIKRQAAESRAEHMAAFVRGETPAPRAIEA